jgi:hypothetical protein
MNELAPVPQQLPSERVVISAPMSFTGAAARAWKLTAYPHGSGWNTAARAATITGVILLTLIWWSAVLCWYAIWGIWLIPYRVIRHGARRRKAEQLQHEELMAAVYHSREGQS